MTIKDVYLKYSIPPNLQEHMIAVTKVCNFIVINWIGEGIAKETIIKSALVHDLGNIVRFDFNKHPEFLGSEQERVDFWKQKQSEIINKYGKDDHEVTIKMLSELGFSEDSIESISAKSLSNSIQAEKSHDWNLKVLLYSDMRVLPWGIGTLEERLKDIKGRLPQYNTRPDLEDLFDACRDIERQIQKHVSVSLNKITQELIDLDNFDYSDVSLF